MSLRRIIFGSIIGSLLSAGLAVGLVYGGFQVSWWLAIILAAIGVIIGGFVAGFIARDPFPGMIAGMITGLFVFVAIFLFFWLVLRAKIIDWYGNFNDINQTIASLLDFIGVGQSSKLGQLISNVISDKYTQYGSDINQLVQKYIPVLSLIIGAIFGGGAFILDAIAGRIGGRLNLVDEVLGD